MAEKTVIVSDLSGAEINGNGATVKITLDEKPNAIYTLDTTADEVAELLAKATERKRAGRPKKS